VKGGDPLESQSLDSRKGKDLERKSLQGKEVKLNRRGRNYIRTGADSRSLGLWLKKKLMRGSELHFMLL